MRRYILVFITVYALFPFGTIIAQEVEFVGSCETPGSVGNVFIDNGNAFLAGYGGFFIIDISDPVSPELVGSYETSVTDVYVSGNYAYLTEDWEGLHILDISDVANPFLTSTYEMNGYVYNNFVIQDYAYVCDWIQDYEIVDISDPYNPLPSGGYGTPGHAYDYFITRNYAYIADGGGGLHIIDISDPSNPSFVGGNVVLWNATGIWVEDDIACISANDYGLRIVDVSNPQEPEQLANYSTISYAYDVAIIENRAFVVEAGIGIEVVDISNPTEPLFVEVYDTPGSAQEIITIGRYIYIADVGSLQILRLNEISDVELNEDELPTGLSISQNHPNPFNAATTISYSLPERNEVAIAIYNILGQRVTTVFEGTRQAGEHTITWDASDFPSGVYFARLEAGKHSENIKMVLLK